MGSLYIIAAILLWSSLGVVVRLSGVPPHVLIFYSASVSVVLLGPLLLRKGYRAAAFRGGRLQGRSAYLLFLGPISLINSFTFFYAFQNTTIANSIFTHYIAPVVVAFLAPLLLREKTSKAVVLSIMLASAGLLILLGLNPLRLIDFFYRVGESGRDALGIMSGLFSGFAYAILIIVIRVFARNYSPLELCVAQNLVISLILLPFVRVFPLSSLWSFLTVGVLHSTAAPLLYFKGMSEVSATRTAVLGYVEPVGAIVFAMVFLGEYPPAISVLGGALILTAGYISLRDRAS